MHPDHPHHRYIPHNVFFLSDGLPVTISFLQGILRHHVREVLIW